MNNSIEFELGGEEYFVNDADSLESWVEGLSSYIKDKAREHYTLAFDSNNERHDLDKDTQRKIAESVSEAFVKFRARANSPVDPNEPQDTWAWTVRHALRQAIGLESVEGYYCAQEDALDHSDFSRLRNDLEDILDDHGGESVDVDDLYSEIFSNVVQNMQELDTSTEMDSYGKPAIKFIFVPELHPNASIDDTTLYLEDLQKIEADSSGFDILMKLTGVDALDLMEALNVDHNDTDLIDKWVKYSSGQAPCVPLVPVTSENNFNLVYMLENAGVRYGTPMWMGELSLNEISALNPLEDIYLSGGSVGVNDWSNGAGWVMDMPSLSAIKIGQTDWLNREYGHEMECQRGGISNTPPQPKKRPSLVLDDSPSFG